MEGGRQVAGPAGRSRQPLALARLLAAARGTGNCKQSSSATRAAPRQRIPAASACHWAAGAVCGRRGAALPAAVGYEKWSALTSYQDAVRRCAVPRRGALTGG
jgi:hypothetical protein